MKSRPQAMMLLLGLLPIAAMGQFYPVAGYVYASTVFADRDLIVVSMSASGGKQAELIALDGTKGTVRWRRTVTDVYYTAQSDNTHEIYEINSGRLVARSKQDGQGRWSIDLTSLPWPKPDSDAGGFLGLGLFVVKKVRSFRTPDRYQYSLVLNGKQFVVFRTGISGGGCVVEIGAQDWVSIDRNNKKIQFGEGSLLAAVRDATLISGQHNSLLELSRGRARDISRKFSVPSWYPETYPFVVNDPQDQFCTFRFEVRQDTGSTQIFYDKLALYDGRQRTVKVIEPVSRHDYQVQWANTDRHMLRFAECGGYPPYKNEEMRNRLPLWIDAYTIDVHFIGELIVPFEYQPSGRFSRGIRFCGTMTDGRFVMIEYVYAFNSTSEPGTEVYDKLVIVDPAVPRITHRIDLSTGGQTSSNIRKAAGADVAIQVLGDGDVKSMDASEAKRELTVRAISLRTGGELWRHREAVTMLKIE